jgi:hypothetical protein
MNVNDPAITFFDITTITAKLNVNNYFEKAKTNINQSFYCGTRQILGSKIHGQAVQAS